MHSKAHVKVIVKKIYKYPKSMLSKDMYLDDARQKAAGDFINDITEIIHNDHEDISLDHFELDVIDNKGWDYQKNIDVPEKDAVRIKDVIELLARNDFEKKNGSKLDPLISPQFFDHYNTETDKFGNVLREEHWHLKNHIEDELYNLRDKYYYILDVLLKKDIPKKKKANNLAPHAIRWNPIGQEEDEIL
jgi:hypothetical protein